MSEDKRIRKGPRTDRDRRGAECKSRNMRVMDNLTPTLEWLDHARVAIERYCGKKKCYWTRRIGKRAAKAYQMHTGDRMEVYSCDHCGFWHMGHPKQRKRKRPDMAIYRYDVPHVDPDEETCAVVCTSIEPIAVDPEREQRQ